MTDSPGTQSLDRVRSWLLDLVHAHRLSPTQRRVAQHMLDSLPDVAFASSVDVAEAAGVSQPTVTRMATAFGFSGWAEFRAAARERVLSASPTDSPSPGPDSVPAVALARERDNLLAVEQTVASDRMVRAVDLLAGTRPLGIVGLRVSASLAHYLGHLAQKVLPDVRVLDDGASLIDAVTQLHLDGASAVLFIVMPRHPEATVQAVAHARSLGLATVAIVDTPLVPFADLLDVALVAPVGTDLVFDSHAAVVTLSIALLDALARREPRRTQARLEAHEELVPTWEHQVR
ncbi:MurR/RpiR family transcriptional regulator [Frigoribacterium sp. PvP032]|uniref:MurR/RpiR family transcriptional regulator n=1 Tax=Frigoribacterium sp. PvP032 TaxID=2806589 RepID=UPI001B791C92|nr:MurR/RpiR family transcriptional regulator [Frigoribacterium sp. PvP032]MBP1190479.1 DNA-binding MurR/RpiR family transcriptional regulator [Frigoribacterium sp. PvP032]